jgi:transcriptional regulator with XRE-family HTH domain
MVVVVTMTDNDSSSRRGSSAHLYGRVSFGDEVRRRREALGLTLGEFAERCRLTPNYIGSIENGYRDPSLSTIYAIAKGFGVHPGELLGPVRGLSPVGYEATREFDRASPDIQEAILMLLHAIVKKPST